MTDRRELILARLREVSEGVTGVAVALRNQDELSETRRPAILIFDGDEIADESDPIDKRPSNAPSPRRVSMTPQISILLGDTAANVGTSLNTLRALFLKAVFTDVTLHGFVLSTGGIRYLSAATGLGRGRKVEGEMGIQIAFVYPLQFGEL